MQCLPESGQIPQLPYMTPHRVARYTVFRAQILCPLKLEPTISEFLYTESPIKTYGEQTVFLVSQTSIFQCLDREHRLWFNKHICLGKKRISVDIISLLQFWAPATFFSSRHHDMHHLLNHCTTIPP